MTTFRRALRTLLFLTTLTAPLALAELVDLSVTKSGPAQATPGSDIVYTVTVSNAGPDATVDVATLTDTPSGATTFVSAVQNSGPAFNCDLPEVGSPEPIVCTAATLPAGSTATFTFTFNLDAQTPAGVTFTNVATISLPERTDANGIVIVDTNEENNSSSVSTSTPAPPAADLSVTKSGPTFAGPGTDVTYTISLSNLGPGTASNVDLTDTLPGTLTFVSLGQTSGPTLSCTTPAVGAGGTISCSIGTLSAGATANLTLIARVPADTVTGTEFSNTATVTSADNDPNEENNSSTTSFVSTSTDLSVTKSAPASVAAGAAFDYTLTVANSGLDPAAGVALTDVLPSGTTFVSLTQVNGPSAPCARPPVGTNGTVQCFFEVLGAGTSATFTLRVTAGTASPISNTATVSSDNFDTDPSDNSSTTSTNVTPSADLSVTKTGPATVERGANATFTIVVTNNGPSAATSVTLTDVVPTGTTFVSLSQTNGTAFSCTTPAVGAGGTVTCSAASLASTSSATFTLTVNVGAGAPSPITNTASASSAISDPNAANDSSTASVNTTLVNLTVTKSGPASATAGTDLTYSLTLVNSGTIAGANVSLNDVLPTGTTFVSLSQTSGPAFSCTTPAVGSAGTVTCTIASLAINTPAAFTLVARLQPSATGPNVVNTATASTTNVDPTPADNTASATTAVATSADLSVTKQGPASATAGTNVTYTVNVTNNGPSDATSVTLVDTPPTNATFVSATQNSGPTFSCTTPAVGATGTVTCSIAMLPNGSSADFTLVFAVSPDAAGSVANTATVSSATNDPNSANNTSTVTAAGVASADLAVAKTGPATVPAGTTATYSVTLTNNGPGTATTVVLTDALPPNTTFVSATQNSGPAFNCTTPAAGATGTITCTAASLTTGAVANFTIVLALSPTATASSPLSNTATISSATPDPNASNNSSTVASDVTVAADLAVTKVGPAGVASGASITYTITAMNNGPADATGVTFTDVIPTGTTYTSVSQMTGPTFTCNSLAVPVTGTLSCSAGSFPRGATATFTLVVATSPSTTGAIVNTVTITSSTPDPLPGNNSATSSVTATPTATDLSIVKTSNVNQIAIVGSNVTYTLVVTNNGPALATGTTVTDTLPGGMTPTSVTTSQGTCSGSGVVVCTLGNLASGASATITIGITLPATASSFTNTATVASVNADTNPANNSSTVTFISLRAQDIPTLSPLTLALLAIGMAVAAWSVMKVQ